MLLFLNHSVSSLLNFLMTYRLRLLLRLGESLTCDQFVIHFQADSPAKKSFKIRISLEKNYKTINKIKDLKTSSPERRLKKENRKVLRKSFEFSLQSIFTISRVNTIPIRKDFTLIFLSSLARTNDQQILKSISLQPLESKYGSMWFSKDFISFNYYFINFLGDIFSG